MDMLPLHPKLVHLPIALAVLMPLVSAGLLFAWLRGLLPKRAWVVALALQGVLVASSVAALRSGEGDEERVENVVAESAIEAHEEAAEAFTWATGGALLLFAAGLALPGAAGRRTATAATAATLLVLFLGYRVGQAGGALVYQHGAASAWTQGGAAAGGEAGGEAGGAAGGEADEDDDD